MLILMFCDKKEGRILGEEKNFNLAISRTGHHPSSISLSIYRSIYHRSIYHLSIFIDLFIIYFISFVI